MPLKIFRKMGNLREIWKEMTKKNPEDFIDTVIISLLE